MKNILVLGLILFTSLVHAQVQSISSMRLVDLAQAKREVYMVVNQTILPKSGNSTLQFEQSKGGMFASDKYTMRINFGFNRKSAYGSADGGGSQFLPLAKGSVLKITEVENDTQYSDSSMFFISARGQETKLADNQISFSSAFIQILGNKKDSVSKLTVGDLEKTFDNAITLYVK